MNVKPIIIGLLILILGLLPFSIFRVQQWEHAVVFKFREISYSNSLPGLHVMIPFVNTVRKFEKRLLTFEQEAQRFLTSEKKDVLVDYYVKWQILDPGKFYTATRGDLFEAGKLLTQRVNGALRDEFGERTVQEVVAGTRGEIMDIVTETIAQINNDLGVRVVDIRTKRIDLPEEVSESVYERMRAERTRVAKDLRARGSEAAERITASADREREVILANAYRDAEIVRGEGDAIATKIYAVAFTKDEEFYELSRSLNAYKSSFQNNNNNLLLLGPDADFFKYFNHPDGVSP